MQNIKFKVFLIWLTGLGTVWGSLSLEEQEYSPALMPAQSSSEIALVKYRTNRPYGSGQITLRRFQDRERIRYHLIIEGRGNYDTFHNVRWRKTALLEERRAWLYTLKSSIQIRSLDGHPLVQYQKDFDYAAHKVIYHKINKYGHIVRQKEFPIQGRICDEVTMIYFLKVFAALGGKDESPKFYLLTSEPRLYHVWIKNPKRERLSLPLGEVEAVRLQLIADVGPLTDLAVRIVPPTFVWFAAHHPYTWLQYEGMDAGYGSPKVRIFLKKHLTNSPAPVPE